MEMPPQAKRIRLEHSYANSHQYELITIKQEQPEDPLSLTDQSVCVGTIKLEIGDNNLIKTEPVDHISEDEFTIEYSSNGNVNEPVNQCTETTVQSTEGGLFEKQTIKVETDVVNENNPVVASAEERDPLELGNYEVVQPKAVPQTPTVCRKTYPKENNVNTELAEKERAKLAASLLQLQKSKDNLQKQIYRLKIDLQIAATREKSLHIQLEERKISELKLQVKNGEMKERIQELWRKEKANVRHTKELNHKAALAEQENLLTKKECNEKVEQLKQLIRQREKEHKQMDIKCGGLSHTVNRLNGQLMAQKGEMDQLKEKLLAVEQAGNTHAKNSEHYKKRLAEATNELALARRNNEELQKSLLTEKKMSRFFIKERDQLLEEQSSRFKETDKQLAKLKQSMGSITMALTQKVAECKTHKDALRVLKLSYQRKSLEVKNKMEELEKKELELSKKVCEYCGF